MGSTRVTLSSSRLATIIRKFSGSCTVADREVWDFVIPAFFRSEPTVRDITAAQLTDGEHAERCVAMILEQAHTVEDFRLAILCYRYTSPHFELLCDRALDGEVTSELIEAIVSSSVLHKDRERTLRVYRELIRLCNAPWLATRIYLNVLPEFPELREAGVRAILGIADLSNVEALGACLEHGNDDQRDEATRRLEQLRRTGSR